MFILIIKSFNANLKLVFVSQNKDNFLAEKFEVTESEFECNDNMPTFRD